MKKLFSWFLILQSFSLLTVGAYQIYLHESPSQLAFDNYSYAKPEEITQKTPKRITISSLGIDLPIYKAAIINNIWPTTGSGVSYLTSSPLPGEKGNSVIYAHNWRSLFGKLVDAKIGDSVVVMYPDNTKKVFIISYTSIVSPSESTILASSNDKRITLYTCTGFLDSKRFVAVAILKS
ncbi:MAG TPA: sortase [Candidatus Sulfotelmatobacter sp.]|jgi:LPXTG-site transpeptidase (sortase) family protein|nr:sortase [Candidatus Sulfotelmatobacter sp.]